MTDTTNYTDQDVYAASKALTLLPVKAIKAHQATIKVRMMTLDADVHSNAIQCYLHAKEYGDTTPLQHLIIDCLGLKGSGYRVRALIAHMQRFTPCALYKDVIRLTGNVNGVPIPWDIETAALTPFWTIPDFDEVLAFKPVYKDGVIAKIAKASKEYRDSVGNAKIVDGKVVGPIDPTKPFYDGIHLDKMDDIFDRVAKIVEEFETFNDDTAVRAKARKQKAEAEAVLAGEQ
jgi:hypothetical protein